MINRLQDIISESGYLGLLRRAATRVERETNQLLLFTRDTWKGTYKKRKLNYALTNYLNSEYLSTLTHTNTIPAEVISHYLDHRFDLLGSGWVQIYHGMNCRGLQQYRFFMSQKVQIDPQGNWLKGRINPSNLLEAQQIWQHIDPNYKPIDWQLDFKSGYRWSEQDWSKKIKFGHKLGADVKVPWELARMQHLPQLALVFISVKFGSLNNLSSSSSSSSSSLSSPTSRGLTTGSRSLSLSLDPVVKPRDVGIKINCQDTLPELNQCHILSEYQNQILDFIATNPSGFGVNWICPMDVAIRAVNWLVARDIFKAGQVQFSEYFESILSKSIYEHGLYLIQHLEWNPERANHYLADIAGLAYIAAYLPSDAETDTWLAFAVQELIIEVDRQFYEDGGNFEGSTAYHRLSTEMVYYATTLILGLPKERLEKLQSYDHTLFKNRRKKPHLQPAPMPFYLLPNETTHSPFPLRYFERMERMVEFIIDITKPNGHIPQIGDNDSGRFLKLTPKYQKITVKAAIETYKNLDNYNDLQEDDHYFIEDHLDCSHIVRAGFELFNRADFANFLAIHRHCERSEATQGSRTVVGSQDSESQSQNVEMSFLEANYLEKEKFTPFEVGTEKDLSDGLLKIQKTPDAQIHKTEYTDKNYNLLEELTLCVYPNFGIYIFKSPQLYLLIRCWTGTQINPSSHRHEDQLSIELSINGHDLICDPGTYLYTPIPSERHQYRYSNTHFSPFSNNDHSSTQQTNVFSGIHMEKVRVTYFGRYGFIAETIEQEVKSQLIIQLRKESVTIYHLNNTGILIKNSCLFSPGYGLKLKQ